MHPDLVVPAFVCVSIAPQKDYTNPQNIYKSIVVGASNCQDALYGIWKRERCEKMQCYVSPSFITVHIHHPAAEPHAHRTAFAPTPTWTTLSEWEHHLLRRQLLLLLVLVLVLVLVLDLMCACAGASASASASALRDGPCIVPCNQLSSI